TYFKNFVILFLFKMIKSCKVFLIIFLLISTNYKSTECGIVTGIACYAACDAAFVTCITAALPAVALCYAAISACYSACVAAAAAPLP
ncbi:unnamed protein product, partial [Brachionus calyciflorus]